MGRIMSSKTCCGMYSVILGSLSGRFSHKPRTSKKRLDNVQTKAYTVGMRYRVFAVDRVGNSWQVMETDIADVALILLNHERTSRWVAGKGTAYVIDDETGEQCEAQLKEMCDD